ncbi:MAG: NACHT domain-containing protein [Chloroflexi bacterium CFX6]|nr:NACHT domain-containing protein [Chloroflexi bacterium CFX6]
MLLSMSTQQLVQGDLPTDWALRDWGTHRLKDLRFADRIFQIEAAGLVDVATPLRTATAISPRDRIIVEDSLTEGGADVGAVASAEVAGIRRPANVYEALAATLAAVRGDESAPAVVLSAAQAREAASRRPANVEEYRVGRIAEWSQPRYRLDGRFVALTLLVDQGDEAAAGRWAARQERYDDLGALLAAVPEPAVVVLGPPGSGKSTLLRHLELDAAIAGLRGEGAGSAITFFIQLNQYKPDRPGDPVPAPGDWLASRWAERNPDLPPLDTLLAEGRMILLLDAFNEMPAASEREFRERVGLWKDWLVRLTQTRLGNRVVFSCRTLDYSTPLSTAALRVPQVQIEPLSDAQVEAFLRASSPVRGADIWATIAGTPQLDALRAPFFLSLLVDQVEATGDLAGDRAGLFTGFVRQALRREVERDNPLFALEDLLASRDIRRVAQWQWRGAYELPERGALVPRLAALAYGMQESEADGEASQVRVDYDTALALLDHPRDEDIVKAGLAISVLDEDPAADEVLYRHQLIQEYFAARILAREPRPELVAAPWRGADVRPSVRELIETLPPAETLPPLPTTGWEETTVLAAVMAADAEAFVRGVMATNLALAGRCAAQIAARGVGGAKELSPLPHAFLDDLRWALVHRSRDPEADLRARIAAGLALGWLGDQRFERREGPFGACMLPPVVEIPGGVYPIGDDEPIIDPFTGEDDRSHMPRHDVAIGAFAIGRFAVTNAEYACFMAAGGYDDEWWWDTEAGRAWQRGEGTSEGLKQDARARVRHAQRNPGMVKWWHDSGWIDDEDLEGWLRWLAMTPDESEAHLADLYPGGRKTEPRYWRDGRYNNPAQPVVGISWYEARAYAAWLSAQTGETFRLPTEAEWEVAARGAAGRRYAYGEAFDAAWGNVQETRIRRPTPVGVFVEGDTPEGASDMAGNVVTWTLSRWGENDEEPDWRYPYDVGDGREALEAPASAPRVVRGGSWLEVYRLGRAARRSWHSPDYRDLLVGFRVVRAAPVS